MPPLVKKSLPTVTPTCKGCAFWEQFEQGKNGFCRINPPVINSQLNLAVKDRDQSLSVDEGFEILSGGTWPVTTPGDWCGEYKAKG